MTQVEGLSHLTIHVTDLGRSEDFYRDIMGLDPMGRDLVADDGPTSLFRTQSGHLVVLVEVPSVEPFRGKTTSIHHAWYLTPEQHAAARARMKERGFPIGDTREAMRAMGQKSFDVYDPDGHRYQVQTVEPEAAYTILKPEAGRIDCGNLADYAVGEVRSFNEGKFYLVRREEGFLALSRWCTHMNGLVQWKPNHWHFYCPYHKATFDRLGRSNSHHPFDTLAPLRLHPVAIDANGGITVDTDVLLIRKTASADDTVPAEPGAASDTAAYEHV